ncbi:hypothetical protein [Nocardia vulneris]|uniref:Uncharacterized protein n=1 Tax=Nocardia vulneris TaxID=1141657 RepID=A0ABR4ZA14_9NOCA|nr:hypothetical protein [Nocardia vulneris]KIA62093.1 hypothetical protein FG87_27130 [Nocardia vulneris]
MSASLAELEARVAALEAERADYRAVLAAVNALSQQTRERLDVVDEKINHTSGRADAKLEDTNVRVRSIEETVAEVRDLLVRVLDNNQSR